MLVSLTASLNTHQENLDTESHSPVNSLSPLTPWTPAAMEPLHTGFHMPGPHPSAFQPKEQLIMLIVHNRLFLNDGGG